MLLVLMLLKGYETIMFGIYLLYILLEIHSDYARNSRSSHSGFMFSNGYGFPWLLEEYCVVGNS